MIEEPLHVNVHYPLVSGFDMCLGCFHCLMRITSRSESVAVVTERWLELRTEYLMHRLLDEPVLYRRYTQLPYPLPRLRYLYPFHWTRLVPPSLQLLPDARPVHHQMFRQLLYPHAVHPWCPTIALHPPQRCHQIVTTDDPPPTSLPLRVEPFLIPVDVAAAFAPDAYLTPSALLPRPVWS